MMPRHLLFIPLGLYRSFFGIARKPIRAISLENLMHATGRDLQAMIPFQEPGDPQLAQMVGLSKIENLFFNLWRYPKSGVLRESLAVDHPRFPILSIALFQLLISLAGNAKLSAGFRNIPNFQGII